MEYDIMKLIQEVDRTNEDEVQSVRWIITTLRAALKTGTTPEFVKVAAEFAGGRIMDEEPFCSAARM